MKNKAALIGTLALAASFAQAGSLSGTLTADNEFSLYLSTSDSVRGDLIATGNSWTNSYSFSNVNLLAGQDYFLHAVVHNFGTPGTGSASGNPASFLGQFSLSDSNHSFSNGTQSLLSNSANWKFNDSGFGQSMVSATDLGKNGGNNIWGNNHGPISGISTDASWIWGSSFSNGQTGYLSSKVAATPEPASIGILASGAFAFFRRRKSA